MEASQKPPKQQEVKELFHAACLVGERAGGQGCPKETHPQRLQGGERPCPLERAILVSSRGCSNLVLLRSIWERPHAGGLPGRRNSCRARRYRILGGGARTDSKDRHPPRSSGRSEKGCEGWDESIGVHCTGLSCLSFIQELSYEKLRCTKKMNYLDYSAFWKGEAKQTLTNGRTNEGQRGPQ